MSQVVLPSPGDDGAQNVKKAACTVIKACYAGTRAQARIAISSFCDHLDILHAWRPALDSLVDEYREVDQPVRDSPGKPSPEALLQVLSHIRKKDKQLLEHKEETRRTIDMVQPLIVTKKKNGI